MKLIGADEVARRARAAVGYSGMTNDDFEETLAARGIVSAASFRRIIARKNPTRGASIEELWEIADVAGVPRAFMEDGFVDVRERDELAELRRAVATVAAAVSLESLEAAQRQFLEGWLRRTPSQGSIDEPGTSTRGEG